MSDLFKKRESVLGQKISSVALKHLIIQYGVESRLFRAKQNIYSKVYGMDSGEEGELIGEFKIMLTGDTFAPVDAQTASLMSEAWLYCLKIDEFKSDDTLEIAREDGRAYKFKLQEQHSIGVTSSVIRRYRIVPTGDTNL